MSLVRILTVVSLSFFAVSPGHAEPIGVDGARKLPIVDTHFHPMAWMEPAEILERMTKHNVPLFGGAAYQGHFKKHWIVADELGERYIWAEGTSQLNAVVKKGGTEALENADHPIFKKYLGLIERGMSLGNVKVIGEVFINTRTSSAIEWRKWKIKADSTGMRALYNLATDNGIPMMVHAQLDDDTAEQLVRLAQSRPEGKLVLGHCGKDSTADEVRAVFKKASNTTCNLAYRSKPQETHRDENRYIWSSSGIKEGWRKLMEDFPDRFMVGIDDPDDWDQFDEVVETIRDNLLANLTAATAEKVAHKNARRIYGL